METMEPQQKLKKHVVITGTGRAGTTFLIELLTHLGLDTGFSPDNLNIDKTARAGLELDIRDENAPYIIKNPWFLDYADEVFAKKNIVIEHIFIPMREISEAAKSRSFVDKKARSQMDILRRYFKKSSTIKGGLWHAKNQKDQEIVLLNKLFNFLLILSETFIPVTFLRFPKMVNDPEYLFEKLNPILTNIDFERFSLVFSKIARPDLVHNFNKKST